MTYQIRRLGWLPDAMDHRDCDINNPGARARLNKVVPALSRNVAVRKVVASPGGAVRADLRQWCSSIEQQGDIGSCTAHAVVGALEYFERKTRGEHVDASRRFLYRVTRRYLGWEGKGDTGAFLRSAIKALRLFGALPEQYWPYDEAAFDAEPEGFHYAFAQNYKALEYFRVPEKVADLQQVLLAGLPFVFGFTCFNSIFDDEVARTGLIPYPRKNEKTAGGHAVMAVGYTDSHILIRNSWGKGWGDRGYGYLPWSYFDSAKPLADDCWVLVNAAWMADDEGEATPKAYAARAMTESVASCAEPDADAERTRAQVSVARGNDPTKGFPLRFAAKPGVAQLGADPGAQVQLVESRQAVSLYLRELTLLDSFDFGLFTKAENELYVLAVVWDLSGAPPVVFPPAQVKDVEYKTYALKEGQTVKFVGDGLQLWPSQPIRGGLYVRLIILESDDDVRAVGKQIASVHEAVRSSELVGALAPLATAALGISAPALAAVGIAANLLTKVVAEALQRNGDDLVALFDGTYGAETVSVSREDRYSQLGAEIQLNFVVTEATGPKATKGAAKPRAAARGVRKPRK